MHLVEWSDSSSLYSLNLYFTLLDFIVRLLELLLWAIEGPAEIIEFEFAAADVLKLLVVERVPLIDAEILFNDWAGE